MDTPKLGFPSIPGGREESDSSENSTPIQISIPNKPVKKSSMATRPDDQPLAEKEAKRMKNHGQEMQSFGKLNMQEVGATEDVGHNLMGDGFQVKLVENLIKQQISENENDLHFLKELKTQFLVSRDFVWQNIQKIEELTEEYVESNNNWATNLVEEIINTHESTGNLEDLDQGHIMNILQKINYSNKGFVDERAIYTHNLDQFIRAKHEENLTSLKSQKLKYQQNISNLKNLKEKIEKEEYANLSKKFNKIVNSKDPNINIQGIAQSEVHTSKGIHNFEDMIFPRQKTNSDNVNLQQTINLNVNNS